MVCFSAFLQRIDTYGVNLGESIGVQNFSTDALRYAPAASWNVVLALLARTGLLHC